MHTGQHTTLSGMRAILIDIPHEDIHRLDLPTRESASDDEEMSRSAYSLAMCDIALLNHGFVASELLANLGQSGHWTDCALRSLMTDLRFLGPHATANTIMTSLASAFEEVITEELENNDGLVEAFGELALRFADMFTVGSHETEMVVRCIIEEGLKYVVPNALASSIQIAISFTWSWSFRCQTCFR